MDGRTSSRIGGGLALRGRHLLAMDVACVGVAFVLAFALRFDGPSPAFQAYLGRFLWLLGPLLAIRIGANLYFRLYQRLWRYASIDEMQAILLAAGAGSLLFGLLLLGLGVAWVGGPATGFPRSIVAIEWLLSTALLGATRFSLRTVQARRWVGGRALEQERIGGARRVLIAGAGDAGASVAKELLSRPRLAMEPVGFIDDDPAKRGLLIHGVKVVGGRSELAEAAGRLGAELVIVAMPTAPGRVIREILRGCEEIGVRVMTVPGMAELISGEVSVSQVRPVQLEDLLRREPASLDLESISGFLEGATVMVTGAGGSIGSELCRQIVRFRPERLLLLGRGENSIYQIHQELLERTGLRSEEWDRGTGDGDSAPSGQRSAPGVEMARGPMGRLREAGAYPPPLAARPTQGGGARGPAPRHRISGTTQLVPIIADIRDLPRLKALVREHRPTVIFHAAAHKHVPLMEANPSEAVATNILGTRNLLEAAVEAGVEGFVLVSTDKAVNPTNVMGATKRVAELLLKEAAARTGRRFVAVRFGNVLGSRGSVVPLFKRQIEAGGPVTVTHREITRYFMTIPEASQLIIQAAAMGSGGEIFVLDMGEPIRVYDLALELIRLSGLEPFRDVDVRITGLRPGEKLHEELFTASEARVSTRHSRIFVSTLQPSNGVHLGEGLAELEGLLASGCADGERVRAALRRIVPEYRPAP